MMTTTHPLADDYLRRLDRAARVLSRRDREELVAEIRTHLDSGLNPDATEADVRNMLDELGPPESIVAAAHPERPPVRRGAREVFALILLVTGLPPVLGWLAGVGLLLWSPLWSMRQKLLGILVWPGGYVMLLGLGTIGSTRSCRIPSGEPTNPPTSCVSTGHSTGWWIIVLGVLTAAPLVVATYLYWAAGRRAETA